MAYDGSIKFDTKIDTGTFQNGISKLKSTAKAGFAAVGAAAAAGIGAAVKVGMDFEAQMSKVGAISMASAEDMEILSAKAKEMGETTVFSASQAGEAFEYMAMAGWKTEEMTAGIAGIMDLAAASGENLGTVSDIVTDALTAFGLSAQDSGRFADVLAAASSNANTNVSMMGETFKYVAPVAGAMGYSIEDTAVAIGLMANSGIKASQAGTSLRQILLGMQGGAELSAKAFGTMTVNVENSDGTMRDLNDVIADLRSAFSKMTAAEKAANAENIAGKIGMSGLLAIVNAGGKDFDKLTDAIDNSAGTAKKMADRNLDNLKGQLTLAGSAAEGLGIAIYEGIESPLKNAVKVGAKKISELTVSLKSGGLQGALANVGELFGNLAGAVINVATAAIPPITSALGFLGDNLQSIAPLILGVVTATKLYNTIGTATTAMMAAKSAATAVLTAHEAAHRLTLVATNGGLTVFQTLVGLCTGKITLQAAATGLLTKAQVAFNAAAEANPIGLFIGIAVGVVAAIYAVSKALNKETEAEKAHREAVEKNIAAIEEQKKAYEDSQKSIYDKANADLAQIGHVQSLYGELDRLVDANGRVDEANRARVQFILGEMNDALGTEYTMTDGLIQKYDGLKQSVFDVINAKKLEILMQAQEESYTEAIKNQAEAQQARAQAYAAFEPVRQKYEDAMKNLTDAEKNYTEAVESGDFAKRSSAETAMAAAKQEVDKIKGEYDRLKGVYETADQTCKDYNRNIEVYQEAATMATAGNVETAVEYLEKNNAAYLNAEKAAAQYAKGTEEHLGTLGSAYASNLLELKSALDRYGQEANASTKKAVLDALDAVRNSKEEYGAAGGDLGSTTIKSFIEGIGSQEIPMDSVIKSIKASSGDFSEVGALFSESTATGMDNGQVPQKAQEIAERGADGVEATHGRYVASGEYSTSGIVEGLLKKSGSVYNTGFSLGLTANRGYNDAVKVGSPAKEMIKSGEYTTAGLVIGMLAGKQDVYSAGYTLGDSAVNGAKKAADIHSPSKEMQKEVGLQLALGAAKGVLQGIPNIKTAMQKTIKSGISYAEKAAGLAKRVGEMIPAELAAGMAENGEAATKQFDKMLEVLDHQRELDLINETEYYERLEKLRDTYLSEGTKEYAQQTEKIYGYYKELAKEQEELLKAQKAAVQELFSDVAEYAADKLEDVQGEIDSFAGKLRGIGALYDEVDWGEGRKFKVLHNFDEDIAVMEQYSEQLTALREKLGKTDIDDGTIKMFFAQMRDLDLMEGQDLARMFNQLSEADFIAYMERYKKRYDVSQEIADALYGDEYSDAVQDINAHTSEEIVKFMKEELEAAGAEIPDGFFDVGRQAAENFSDSFLTVFQNMLNEMKYQFDALSATIAPRIAYAGGGTGTYTSTVYGDTNYNIYGGNSDDLTAQIQAMETRKRMLGIGG